MNPDTRAPGRGLGPVQQGTPAVGDSGLCPELQAGSRSRAGPGGGGERHLRVLLPSVPFPVPPAVDTMAVFFLRVREPTFFPVTGGEDGCWGKTAWPRTLSERFGGGVPWCRCLVPFASVSSSGRWVQY